MPGIFLKVYSSKPVLFGIAVLYISISLQFFSLSNSVLLKPLHASNKQIMGRGGKARGWKGKGKEGWRGGGVMV